MTQAMNNGSTPVSARLAAGALPGVEEKSANGMAGMRGAANAPEPGCGPLAGHLIGHGDGETGAQAQANRANYRDCFAARLSAFGWSIAMLPVSLFNIVTSGLLAAGNATVSALASVLPGRTADKADDSKANVERALKPRPVPKSSTQVPPRLQTRYNNLIRQANLYGIQVGAPAYDATQASSPASLAQLESFLQEVSTSARDAYLDSFSGDTDKTAAYLSTATAARKLATEISNAMYSKKPLG